MKKSTAGRRIESSLTGRRAPRRAALLHGLSAAEQRSIALHAYASLAVATRSSAALRRYGRAEARPSWRMCTRRNIFIRCMISLLKPPCDAAIMRGAPDTPGCASHAKRWVLIATILGSSVAFLEGSIINVALPAIQTALGASVAGMQWIASAYTLLLASLTLVGGAAGDRFGRQRLFRWGTAILAGGSVACGAAANPSQLIAGRAIQGFGAALLVPNSLALLSARSSAESTPKSRKWAL